MALAAIELTEIERMLASPEAAAQLYLELRRKFPHLAWIRCDASDVAEDPVPQLWRVRPAFARQRRSLRADHERSHTCDRASFWRAGGAAS